ncbi:MAG: Lrp/AsnC family transcriptional regulator [Pseudomonadota bacterium]
MKRSNQGKPVLDEADKRIITELQRDAALPVADLAERVGLTTSPCWRRVQRLKEAGVLGPLSHQIDPAALNLSLTVFVAVRTAAHNAEWLAGFHAAVDRIPEIVTVHRLAGQIDYLLKVMVPSIEAYDAVYKKLTESVDITEVTSMISMETIRDSRQLPVTYA